MSDDTSAPAGYVVIDVEATCDDGGRVPRHEREIIGIGAVLVSGESHAAIDEFQSFVRPVRHPVLTPFCTGLTSITQADVEAAPGFPEVFGRLTRWIQSHPAPHVFCSWGDYDRTQFERDCVFHGIPYALPQRHVNLKRAFSERLGTSKKFGMAAALAQAGLPLAGTHHRGRRPAAAGPLGRAARVTGTPLRPSACRTGAGGPGDAPGAAAEAPCGRQGSPSRIQSNRLPGRNPGRVLLFPCSPLHA